MGTLQKPGKFDCLKKLAQDEPFFVLCGRDPKGADLVRDWVQESKGLHPTEKLEEALQCADAMDHYHGTLKSAAVRKAAGLTEPEPKNRPGRQPAAAQPAEDAPKRPGRPRGSTNKPKAATKKTGTGRKPGRPKGSTNKPKAGETAGPESVI